MIPQRFLNADAVKAQIQKLLADCPELHEDDEALVMSLHSETDALRITPRRSWPSWTKRRTVVMCAAP